MDMKESVQLLDREGMAKAVLYPTLGLLWEAELFDTRALERVLPRVQPVDRRLLPRLGGRLIPIAHLSLGGPGGGGA